jgi:membrane-associated phospholipid phosphatase
VRRSEWLLIAYFTYAGMLAQFLLVRPPVPLITLALNLTVIAGFGIVANADALRRRRFLSILRDWYPAPLMLLAYREMGWFAPARRSYELENVWVAWDKALLNNWGLKPAIELLGPLLPSLLEISYSLVYTIPFFALAMLYIYGWRSQADRFLVIFLLGILTAYALFPCFPSEPPRTVFPGEDYPSADTVFRRFNWWLLGGYGIHTSVFPSAHVAGAFSAAFAMLRLLRERQWVGRLLLVLAVLIATATVYGRYHYAADAVAGLGIALLAYGLGVIFEPPTAEAPSG